MSPDSNVNPDSSNGSSEKQLCTACLFPNEPFAHFCTKCGAPISSYVAIAPFESAFAQGYVFRQAAERPRSLVVLVGIWLIFGSFLFRSVVTPAMAISLSALSCCSFRQRLFGRQHEITLLEKLLAGEAMSKTEMDPAVRNYGRTHQPSHNSKT
jgi:hypothetical protein